MSDSDRITELKIEIKRMRENERNNVRLLKLLYLDLVAMDEQSGGVNRPGFRGGRMV